MNSPRFSNVVFVDLDGTAILDNSYYIFLRSLWLDGGWRERVDLIRALGIRLVFGRAARVSMKRRVARSFAGAEAHRQEAIVGRTLAALRQTISMPVQRRVDEFKRQGWTAILATAALDCYARPLAAELGYEDCLATPVCGPGADWRELRGDRKAEACRAWSSDHGGAKILTAAISDHADDLPLLHDCSHVVIQAKREYAMGLAEKLSGQTLVEILDPTAAEDGGGIWLWFLDAPSGPYDPWEVSTIASKHRYALLYVGDGWRRLLPGASLGSAVLRVDCPSVPAVKTRLAIAARRVFFRDALGVFH